MAKRKSSAYAAAGVDIDRMADALKKAKRSVLSTKTPGVVSDVGSFGGLFKSPGKDHLLVSSTDGVGTKLNVAHLAKRHDTIGQDLVNHCVNDILVQGAKPLFFLDYLGTAKLSPKVFSDVVGGLAKACRLNGCALIGGETAEMPGLYPAGEYDLVGTIIGAVKRSDVITGAHIKADHVILGLPSSGLHTNGYTLARHILFKQAKLNIGSRLPGTKKSVADTLLATHKSYLKPVSKLFCKVKVSGLAHITGGGLVDNVPRIMPRGLSAVIDRSSWKVPAVFQALEELGKVDHEEMYRVFNMGIGMAVFVPKKDTDQAISLLKKAGERPKVIGRVARGSNPVSFLH